MEQTERNHLISMKRVFKVYFYTQMDQFPQDGNWLIVMSFLAALLGKNPGHSEASTLHYTTLKFILLHYTTVV